MSMSSARLKRLTALCKRACLLPLPEHQWRQAARQHTRAVTTLRAQDASMMTGHGRGLREQSAQNEDKSFEAPIPRGPQHPNFRIPEIPNSNRPSDLRGHVGTSSSVDRNVTGDTNRIASADSAYLGHSEDVHAMRSAYNNAEESHLRGGTNAGIVHQESKGLPRPDGESPAAAKAAMGIRTPSNTLFAATNQRLPGDIPQQHNSSFLAQEYHIRKARIHASLWQQEIRKRAGDLEGNANFVSSDSLVSTSNLGEGKETAGWDANKTAPEDWETFDPPDGELYNEGPGMEEALMFEEFEKRRERNRIKIASFVKQHLYGRRRPVDGWKYIINNFGSDRQAAKGSAVGARQQTTANDLEKLALKRESRQLRRKV